MAALQQCMKLQASLSSRFDVQLAALSSYVSSFVRVGSFEEAVWLAKARAALKALGASSVRLEIQTPFLTLDSKVGLTFDHLPSSVYLDTPKFKACNALPNGRTSDA